MEKKEYFVAIDLGSSNVVVAVGSKSADGKVEVEGVAVAAVQGQGVIRGEIKNIEEVAKAIKEAVDQIQKEMCIKINDAYTGISGQHIKFSKHSYHVFVGRDGEIKEGDVQKLTESMRNVQAPEGQTILHIIPQNYILDNNEEVTDPIGMFSKKLEATFNFIIGNNQTVSRLEKALMKVDIKQAQMFLNPLVTSHAVVLPDEKELGVAVLDIGAGTTDMCIYLDGVIRHMAVIPLGSDTINKDIRSYGIMERYVENLKIQYGSAVNMEETTEKLIKIPGRTPREISFTNLALIIEARMMDILNYAMEEIKYAGCESKLGAGIVITGGGAKLKNIEVLIKNQMGMEVRIATPDIWVAPQSVAIVDDPKLSTAVGILINAIDGGRPNNVEVFARPVVPAQPAFTQPVSQPISTSPNRNPAPRTIAQQPVEPQNQPLSQPQIEPRNEDDDPDEYARPQKPKKAKKQGKNLFKRLSDGVTKMFDVIDDNEI